LTSPRAATVIKLLKLGKGTLEDRLDGITKVFSQRRDPSWIIAARERSRAAFLFSAGVGLAQA
jgi:hypothetical protein